MIELLHKLFESRFMPHGHCFFWTPDILWMSVISDALISLSYYVIPLGLVYLVRRRQDLAFSWIFYLFGIFILSCGTTHVMGIITLWHPLYRLEAVIKVITALSSLPTAIALVQLLPKAVALPSPAQLHEANIALQKEVADRRRAEDEVRRLNAELERRVQERTAELQQTSERLRTITESSPLGIWACDLAGNVTFWNRAAEGLYGWQREEVMGKPLPTIPDSERADYLSEISKTMHGERMIDVEAKRINRRGEWIDVSFSIAQLQASDGAVTGFLAVVADISERKRAEQALRESELRFRTLADSIPQLAWMADEKGGLFWYNQRWYDYTGTTFEEMQGWGWQKVHHPDHVERVVERFARTCEAGEPWEDTFPLRSRTGEWRWFLSRALPIHDENGKVVRWFGTNTDITEQMAAEEAVRTSESRFRQLADAMPQIVWVIHPDGTNEYYNQRWYEYVGPEMEPTRSGEVNRALHPADRMRAWQAWQKSIETGSPYQLEYRMRRSDGEYRWFLGRALPVYGEDGTIQRWFGTSTDIHDQKRTEEELRQANSDLQQFAYAASHDLQEPLRNMSLYSQLLERNHLHKLDGDASQFLRYIVDGAQRMHALLRDVLVYSRVAAPDSSEFVELDTDLALQEALANLRLAIEESGATVMADPLPKVCTSKSYMVQLFQNLVGNAIKYRQSGHSPTVRIGAERQGQEWVFHVADDGIGIDPQYHAQIFGLFKRLHRDEFPGTGIGLAICQKIMERSHGRIWVESELGKGCTFYFALPADAVNAEGLNAVQSGHGA